MESKVLGNWNENWGCAEYDAEFYTDVMRQFRHTLIIMEEPALQGCLRTFRSTMLHGLRP